MAAVAIVLGLLAVATFVGTLLVFPAMWRGFRDQWRRTPPERKPRAIAGGVATALFIVIEAALAILAPWGPHSVVYVILVGGGAVMLLVFVALGVQAVQDSRKARRHRRGAS